MALWPDALPDVNSPTFVSYVLCWMQMEDATQQWDGAVWRKLHCILTDINWKRIDPVTERQGIYASCMRSCADTWLWHVADEEAARDKVWTEASTLRWTCGLNWMKGKELQRLDTSSGRSTSFNENTFPVRIFTKHVLISVKSYSINPRETHVGPSPWLIAMTKTLAG